MTDPDVPGPSDPYLREHLHWYTLNIHPTHQKKKKKDAFFNWQRPIWKSWPCTYMLLQTLKFLFTFLSFCRIVTDIPGTTDSTFGKSYWSVIMNFSFWFLFSFSIKNEKKKKNRKGDSELRNAKAKYRDPQVCVSSIQAETQTNS